MRFTVLGSGTSVPDPDRGPAGFLVEHEGRSWLVDGGSGTLQRCARAGVAPRTLTGGVYSHRHPDHCADLVPLLFAMRVGPPPRPDPYPIWAGAGFGEYLAALVSVHGKWIEPLGGTPVTELPLDGPASADLGGVLLRTTPANHSAGAVHLRFEAGGRSVVFSGDTGPSEGLVELATGADLLVCECAGSDDEPIEGHLWPSAIADLARTAKPGQIWLTHFYPHVDPDRAVQTVSASGVPTRRAEDGDRFT